MRRTHSRSPSRTPRDAAGAARRGASRRERDPKQSVARPAAPLPPAHPALLAAALIAAACVLAAVTFRIIDTDFWQHLAVGRALWSTHAIPHTELWSWPTYGEPALLRSWAFRALLWPFWEAGELNGLFAWRWITTLLAFGLAWATARRMGARGLTPLVVVVLCGLVYRQRSQVRPETLASVLLALTMWLLARTRDAAATPGADPPRRGRLVWLIPVVWMWANAHITYVLAFVLLGIRLVEAHLEAWRGTPRGPGPRALWLVTAACALAACINPFGWRALWQPFDFLLHWRDTALFQGIGELRAVGWSGNETNGVFLLLLGWPLLLLWRSRRDVAGILTCAFFTAYALPSQRFLAMYALAAAPYVGR
ncbi:MAG TPA: hypothetical protein VJY35_10880, partial [Candidatus Eisenbacteria bacterium]|nr:hypothetical protein [Candidatus Eisenbacteria bacterium]